MVDIVADRKAFTTPRVTGFSRGIRAPRPVLPTQIGPESSLASVTGSDTLSGASGLDDLSRTLSTVVAPIANTIEFGIEESLKDQIRQRKDEVDAEFGVRDAAVIEASADLTVLPEDLQRSANTLSNTTEAFRQGRLKGSTYWARMESIVRQMKTRYPGHIDEIEGFTRRLTGALPANALRRSLMQEAATASTKVDTAKRQEISAIRTWGASAGPKAVQDLQAKRITLDEFIQKGVTVDAFEKELQIEDARLRNKQNQRTDTQLDLEDNANTALSVAWNKTVVQSDVLQEIHNKAIELGRQGASAPQAEIDKLSAAFVLMRQEAINDASVILNDPKYAKLPAGRKEAILNNVKNTLSTIGAGIDAGRLDVASAAARHVKGLLSSGQADIFARGPTIARIAVMAEIFNNQAMLNILFKDPEGVNQIQKAWKEASDIMAIDASGRARTGVKDDLSILKDRGLKTSSERKAHVDKAKQALTADTQAPDTRGVQKNYAHYLFNERNFDYINNIQNADERIRAFDELMTNNVVNRMTKFLDDGDVEAWSWYSNWVANNFASVVSTHVSNINAGVRNRENINVEFDAETTQFKVTETGIRGTRKDQGTLAMLEQSFENITTSSVNQLNNTLLQVKKVVEAEVNRGSGTAENKRVRTLRTIEAMLRGAGFTPNAPKQGPLLQQMINKLRKATQPSNITDIEKTP